jgi:hypothetical protein
MKTRRNRAVVAVGALAFAGGCGGTSNNGGGGGDASNHGDASSSHDGPSGPGSGVYAIPLVSPPDSAGFFYTPTLSVAGSMFTLDLDTGSTDTGIAGASCTSCSGLSPLYTPGASSKDAGGQVQAEYADMSGWSGEVYSDKMTLGAGSPTFDADLVDISTQSMFFSGNDYQGILGVGRDDLAGSADTVTYLDGLFGAGVTQAIAVEMCPTDGTFWLGGYDPSHASSALTYTPMLGDSSGNQNAAFYAVDMTAMQLGSADSGLTSATAGGPILDTGTSLFYIPTAAETKIIAAINANGSFKTLFPSQTMTDPSGQSQTAGCVNAGTGVTDAMVDAGLPKLNMTFGTGANAITLSSAALESYMIDAGGGMYCMVMMPGGDDGEMIMGDMFLRGYVTLIDIANERAGFAPSKTCAAPAAFGNGPREFHKPQELGRGPQGLRTQRELLRRRHR